MYIRIYPAIKTAGQSGRYGLDHWCLDIIGGGTAPNKKIGWSGGDDTLTQVQLHFASQDEAIAQAEKMALPYIIAHDEILHDEKRKWVAKNYAENFSHRRTRPWTH